MKHRYGGRRIVVLITGLAWTSGAAGASFSRIVAFGDSLSDVGNLYTATGGLLPPSPPYYAGRFSNGPVWVEHLADAVGAPMLSPSLAGGTNWAYAGAKSSDGFSSLFIPNLLKQVDNFTQHHVLAPDDLVVVWAGANDFFGGQTNAAAVAGNVATAVAALAGAGGTQFLVPNLSDLGTTPDYAGSPQEPLLGTLTVSFNGVLAAELAALESALGITIFQLDAYSLYADILADPAAYGLWNVTGRAMADDLTVVPNPEGYLYWDGVHPTATAHALLGAYAAGIVPEPGTVLLLGVAVAVTRRRRKPVYVTLETSAVNRNTRRRTARGASR